MVNPAEIKSVSSTSNNDDEGQWSDSSAEAKKVQPIVLDSKTTPSKSTEEPAAAPSPAPVPIQGGEDDVIQVSHVRKIKVNIMESPTPAKAAASNGREELRRSASREVKKRKAKNQMDLFEEEISDSEPMAVIEKSPYEANLNAEKGVDLFSRMRNILKERKGDDYRTVDAEATRIFGPTNAWCLVKANALIDKSGMVYSQEWCNGNIRGEKIGKIPKDLLLVCLVSKRFVKAQDLLLSGLTRDLDIALLVQEALDAWKIKADFPRIRGASKSFQFATKKRDSYKCAIFVARAYSCYKAFSMTGRIDASLMAKVMACLDIMEEHLPSSSTSSKKRRKSTSDVPTSAPPVAPVETTSEDPAAPPVKRKRGRPRKNPLPAPKAPVEDPISQDSDLEDDEDDMIPYNPPAVRGRPRKSSTQSSSKAAAAASTSTAEPPNVGSLSKLISQFEKQYNAMGKIYEEMGETLAELKSKVDTSRTTTEEEIRNELLMEVQENLLKTFGMKKD
eukprot:Nitzschia sp. Nitz4//scaffold212_size37733//27005//28699//NITZ4_007738-RA/size37733-augustus-gene-0.11-mRNA-1//1//CDS//3329542037//7074//frame0